MLETMQIQKKIKYLSNNFYTDYRLKRYDNILDTLSSIKFIIKINFTCFLSLLRNVATTKLKITYMICIVFLLDNTFLGFGTSLLPENQLTVNNRPSITELKRYSTPFENNLEIDIKRLNHV